MLNNGSITKKKIENYRKTLHTEEIALKLKSKTVGIAGLGGLGSNAAVALTRAGIGNLILVDYDSVELSNLNRQSYFLKHVGMYKTDAIKEILMEIDPYINLEISQTIITESNCTDLFKKADLVIEAVDEGTTKEMIIETLLSESDTIHVVAASGMAGYGKNNSISEIKSGRIRLIGDGISEVSSGIPLMSPRVGIVSYMQVNAALEILLGIWK